MKRRSVFCLGLMAVLCLLPFTSSSFAEDESDKESKDLKKAGWLLPVPPIFPMLDSLIRSVTEETLAENGQPCNQHEDCRSEFCADINICADSACGNGIVEGAEACDDGNRIDVDDCDSNCRLPEGNNCVDNGECGTGYCDPETNRCTTPSCGNGIVEGDEACDDGNQINNDSCTNNCEIPSGRDPAACADLGVGYQCMTSSDCSSQGGICDSNSGTLCESADCCCVPFSPQSSCPPGTIPDDTGGATIDCQDCYEVVESAPGCYECAPTPNCGNENSTCNCTIVASGGGTGYVNGDPVAVSAVTTCSGGGGERECEASIAQNLFGIPPVCAAPNINFNVGSPAVVGSHVGACSNQCASEPVSWTSSGSVSVSGSGNSIQATCTGTGPATFSAHHTSANCAAIPTSNVVTVDCLPECVNDTDCPNGLCDNGTCTEQECIDNTDCSGYDYCSNGTCQTPNVSVSVSGNPIIGAGETGTLSATVTVDDGDGSQNNAQVTASVGSASPGSFPFTMGPGSTTTSVSVTVSCPADVTDATGTLTVTVVDPSDSATGNYTCGFCSDGTQVSPEECDDGNTTNDDGCSSTCTLEWYCGDGTTDADEMCDDGNTVGGDGCDANCDTEACGNGVYQPALGEACDDGNTTSGDGCSATCASESECGNSQPDPGEECDDGNIVDGDGCDSSCVNEECGNGVLQSGSGEECDDGNVTNNDGCSSTCLTEGCGDGVTQTGEECDDGGTTSGDGCDSECNFETCGSLGYTDPVDGCAYCYINVTPVPGLSCLDCGTPVDKNDTEISSENPGCQAIGDSSGSNCPGTCHSVLTPSQTCPVGYTAHPVDFPQGSQRSCCVCSSAPSLTECDGGGSVTACEQGEAATDTGTQTVEIAPGCSSPITGLSGTSGGIVISAGICKVECEDCFCGSRTVEGDECRDVVDV